MKTQFSLRAEISAAADTSAGDWSTAALTLIVADPTGSFNSSSIQVGDLCFFDTSSFDTGTVTLYRVTGTNPVSSTEVEVSVIYDLSNDNTAAPDLSYCIGGVGMVTRTTAGMPLSMLPSPAFFQIPENVIYSAENYDRKFRLSVSAADPAFNITQEYSAGQTVNYNGVTLVANNTVPAGAPGGQINFGTTGATFAPVLDAGKTWRGVYDPAVTYTENDVVTESATSLKLFTGRSLTNLGNALTSTANWLPYTPAADLSSVVPLDFVGATASTAGHNGLVPAPATTDVDYFLSGSGGWEKVLGAFKQWDVAESLDAGEYRLKQGVIIKANANIPANTPFAWGTAGATFAPLVFPSAQYQGDYDAATAYALNDVVTVDATSSEVYQVVQGGTGKSLANTAYFIPYTAHVDVRRILEAARLAFTGATSALDGSAGAVPKPLAGDEKKVLCGDGTWVTMSAGIKVYDTTQAYKKDEIAFCKGILAFANDNITANTAFAWGTSEATWQPFVSPDVSYKGNFSNGTIYSAGWVVTEGDTSGNLFQVVTNHSNQTINSEFFVPYNAWSDLARLLEMARTAFTGATTVDDGSAGAVPKPLAGEEGKTLYGDGTWKQVVANRKEKRVSAAAGQASFTVAGVVSGLSQLTVNGLGVDSSDITLTYDNVLDETTVSFVTAYTIVAGDVLSFTYEQF